MSFEWRSALHRRFPASQIRTTEFGIERPGHRRGAWSALGLWFGWPMGSPDGKENVRRGRHHRDLRPLVHGPLQERAGPSLGADRKTIRKYLEPAEASGIIPGGPPMREADWAKLIKSWFPELSDRRLRQITWPEAVTTRSTSHSPSAAANRSPPSPHL